MRVVVAMSGGVDSSAAAALLKEQGFDVIGITLRVWSGSKGGGGAGPRRSGSCCSPDDIEDARAVADRLGIPFYVVEAEELFRQKVVQPFVRSYLSGQTPVPCVSCNQDVKFDFLLRRARALGARLATGHYARVEQRGDRFALLRGADQDKDQSYFLFTLGQEELRELLFPVGELTKAEARAVAARHQLPTTQKPESMEICFVPDGDYAEVVEKLAGPQPGGEIIEGRSGAVLGVHGGVHRFTVGQRKGLGLGGGAARYVRELDPETGRVIVGAKDEAVRSQFHLLRPHWVDGLAPASDRQVRVKIRHRHAGSDARIRTDPVGRITVHLDAPTHAVSPGQAAVFYDGERVLGGGWIS